MIFLLIGVSPFGCATFVAEVATSPARRPGASCAARPCHGLSQCAAAFSAAHSLRERVLTPPPSIGCDDAAAEPEGEHEVSGRDCFASGLSANHGDEFSHSRRGRFSRVRRDGAVLFRDHRLRFYCSRHSRQYSAFSSRTPSTMRVRRVVSQTVRVDTARSVCGLGRSARLTARHQAD